MFFRILGILIALLGVGMLTTLNPTDIFEYLVFWGLGIGFFVGGIAIAVVIPKDLEKLEEEVKKQRPSS